MDSRKKTQLHEETDKERSIHHIQSKNENAGCKKKTSKENIETPIVANVIQKNETHEHILQECTAIHTDELNKINITTYSVTI